MNDWWTAEVLYPRLTEAIITAERLEDINPAAEETKRAFRMVSITEELVAALPTIGSFERKIAQKGAITAAVKAGDFDRACMLFRLFPEMDQILCQDFQDRF